MAESYKGINLSDMKKYIVQTKGKVVSVDKLKKFIDTLPTQKKAKGGIVKKKK
tara:strand:+ start:364 stop:522 length:159 start_codon:yes stop_codon:yes gene_type:complete